MAIANMNDGSTAPPRLRVYLNMGVYLDLPQTSAAPRGDARTVLGAIKAAGYAGVQGGDRAIARELGLGWCASGRINQPAEADAHAAQIAAEGAECSTLHVGWGMESDDEVDRLVGAILEASAKHRVPLYLETHRATITQDIWRTVQLVARHPEVRFNGDFSHWYTGLEMRYGDIDAKLAFLAPVFERVRFFHGRIGTGGHIQVDIGDGADRPWVGHFREMWTRSFVGFLRSARPGDYAVFAPELLPATKFYAWGSTDARGEMVEEGDRWQQSLVLKRIAEECFVEAYRRLREAQARG